MTSTDPLTVQPDDDDYVEEDHGRWLLVGIAKVALAGVLLGLVVGFVVGRVTA
jgi:hypothetical protein